MDYNPLGMQELGNITSADLVVYGQCQQVMPSWVRFMEFADGEGVTPDSRERAVTRMGIDGKFVYGIVMRASQVTLTFLPTSPVLQTIDQVLGMSYARRRGLKWSLMVTYPSIGKVTNYTEGIITQAPDMPQAQDVLGNVAVQWQFGNFETTQIGIDDW